MSTSYSTPTRVFTGLGCRAGLVEHLSRLGGLRVALIGDRGLAQAGVLQQFIDAVEGADQLALASTALAGVDPTVVEAERAAREAAEAGADVVLGVGGGSALSLAKAVALLLTNPAPVAAYAGVERAARRPAPFLAVPTTAGSGSEVSNAFVLHDESRSGNIGIRGWGYEPDVALLDGELLIALPDTPLRDAAVDALSHGFEALWARGATRFTDVPAFAAVRLIRETLPAAIESREPELLQTLLEASTIANFACGNSGLALVHALSAASTIHVSHGRQNGIFLPIVAEFNRDSVADALRAEIDLLPALYDRVAIPTRFDAQELPAEPIEAIVTAASGSPFLPNNVRTPTVDELRALAVRAL